MIINPTNKTKDKMGTKRTMLICLTLVGGTFWRLALCDNSGRDSAVGKLKHNCGNPGKSSNPNQCSTSLANCKNCPRYYSVDCEEQLRKRLQFDEKLATLDLKPVKPAEGSGSSLQQVLLIHRHGDRTPVEFRPNDELKDEPFWAFHGLGQLTNSGKARTHLMGRLIRDRYDQFLNGSVNKNHRISRSSGILRCIESAQLFLSSFLALDRTRSPDANSLFWDGPRNELARHWQPVNIQSVPASLDGLLAESSVCQNLASEYIDNINLSVEVQKIFTDYAYEAEQLKKLIGFDMVYFQEWFWASSVLEVERTYFPDKIRPELLAIYDRVIEAGNKSFTAYQSTKKSRRLRSGLLVQDILNRMQTFKSGDPARIPFVHYSTHDLNLISLLGVLGVWDRFKSRPGYASHIVIELHRDTPAQEGNESEWYVRVFYTPQVPGETQELHLAECELGHPLGRCRLDAFERFMGEYALGSWQNWMRECGNDFSQLDPYQ